MTKIHSKALDKSIEIERVIGYQMGNSPGPTLIFMAGIHGNEPAGVFATHTVFQELKKQRIETRGNIYAIAGNLWALQRGVRYQEKDLNRLWTHRKVKQLSEGSLQPTNQDEAQLIDIYKVINKILMIDKGPFYFFDLHTTSSKTVPFLTVNDSLLNRKFTVQYPSTIILGIEEYLDGPMLSYINELGYVAFGFEGGQHDDLLAIKNHISFIYLTLVFAGSLSKTEIEFQYHYTNLAKLQSSKDKMYEIIWRHHIKEGETFYMNPNYVNFQNIRKGERLAKNEHQIIEAPKDGKIFMPLYQKEGDDGLFVIKKIPAFFLRLSRFLRIMHIDRILPFLPGIHRSQETPNTMAVDLRIARFFAKSILHLLGYRSKQVDKKHLLIKNREIPSRKKDYYEALWY